MSFDPGLVELRADQGQALGEVTGDRLTHRGVRAKIRLGIGIWQRYPPDELIALVEMCEQLGHDQIWYANEKFYRDSYVGLAVAATHTQRVTLGTFVADPYTMHPALTAVAIATLDELSHGRAVLVMGASGASAAPLGFQRAKPAQAIRESVEVIRRLLRGERVDFEGQVIQVRGAQLAFPARADLPIYVASRGNLVLRMAGEVADGVMVASYATPTGLRHALSQVSEGAKRAGRSMQSLALISRVDACVDPDSKTAREAVRPMVARLVGSSYPDRSFLDALGLEIPKEFEAVIAKRDHALTTAAAHLVPDEFVNALSWAGTPEEVARQVSAVVQLGFDHITYLPHPPPGQGPQEIVRRFAREVVPMAEEMVRRSGD